MENPNANTVPDSLERSMVRLADTLRTFDVIATRIRNGLSSTEFPDPVLRDYDHIGSTDGSDNDWNTAMIDTRNARSTGPKYVHYGEVNMNIKHYERMIRRMMLRGAAIKRRKAKSNVLWCPDSGTQHVWPSHCNHRTCGHCNHEYQCVKSSYLP